MSVLTECEEKYSQRTFLFDLFVCNFLNVGQRELFTVLQTYYTAALIKTGKGVGGER